MNKLKEYLDFHMPNRLGFKEDKFYPEWNAGYLEALQDVRRQIELIKAGIHDESVEKSENSVAQLDFQDHMGSRK